MDKRLLRFKHCDSRFYPYLEKVLNRLPGEVKEEILDNKGLEVLGSKSLFTAAGMYLPFDNQINHIVYLNPGVLKEPENQVIHTVAHELAHYVARKGKTGLHEKEAEDLLVTWGFEKEVEEIDYSRPIAESAGYKAGYEWAKKQPEKKLWEDFGEFYEEWNRDSLSAERLDALFYDVDTMSILDEMGMLGEPERTVSSKEVEEESDEDKLYIDNGSLDKGVVWGLMGYLKEKRLEKESHSYQREIDKVEVANTLETIENEFRKLFSLKGFHEYFEEAHRLEIPKLSLSIGELLEKVKENCK